ncbi:hypothetical protein QS257_06815 [Terrilactibacillus sp. S3-3]|nr:hypothetical protein QS257_06815 [Terrilactibacillus sp. S3-3]
MIKWTLTKRIWLSFAFLIVMIGVIIAFVYPFSIQQALEEDSFATIEQEQLQGVLHQNPDDLTVDNSGMSFLERQQAAKSVGNLLVVSGHVQGEAVPASVWKQMKQRVKHQHSGVGRYQPISWRSPLLRGQTDRSEYGIGLFDFLHVGHLHK